MCSSTSRSAVAVVPMTAKLTLCKCDLAPIAAAETILLLMCGRENVLQRPNFLKYKCIQTLPVIFTY